MSNGVDTSGVNGSVQRKLGIASALGRGVVDAAPSQSVTLCCHAHTAGVAVEHEAIDWMRVSLVFGSGISTCFFVSAHVPLDVPHPLTLRTLSAPC